MTDVFLHCLQIVAVLYRQHRVCVPHDALRYEEYVLESVAAAKEQEREELLCDEPFDLDSILDGTIIVEKVESCHQGYGRDKTAG